MSIGKPALLALADGTLWDGWGFGADGEATGEIVFNTSLTGYQEILTDPSYHGQVITFTTPHIGKVGTNPEDDESDRVWASAAVVREISPVVSSWRSRQPLPDYLAKREVVAIAGVDTRALVRHIRTVGAQNCAVSTVDLDPDRLIAQARAARDMNGLDLVREVTRREPEMWEEGSGWWRPPGAAGDAYPRPDTPFDVVAYDFGLKRNILRLLTAYGCRVRIVPAVMPAADVLALRPDGVFLSNGPGDPAACTYAIENVRQLLGQVPIFGICLGHQILALALGGSTYKLKFGHRGGNQPVQVTAGGAVQISSHNHGFAVDAASLPPGVIQSHVNLNDGCCEGLEAPAYRAFAVQYHPESAPGPHDSDELFARFVTLMAAERDPERIPE